MTIFQNLPPGDVFVHFSRKSLHSLLQYKYRWQSRKLILEFLLTCPSQYVVKTHACLYITAKCNLAKAPLILITQGKTPFQGHVHVKAKCTRKACLTCLRYFALTLTNCQNTAYGRASRSVELFLLVISTTKKTMHVCMCVSNF